MDRLIIYETMTGLPVEAPRVESYSWSHGVNAHEGTVEFTTGTRYVQADSTAPWIYSLAIVNSAGRVLAAGPIYKRDVDFGTDTVTVTAGSFWSLLKKRVFQHSQRPILADNTHYWIATDGTRTDWQQPFVSTLGGICLDLIRSQFADIPGVAGWSHVNGSHTRTYDGLELQTVADYAGKLFDDVNPPTVRFDPIYSGGAFAWDMRIVGETYTPRTFAFSLDTGADVVTEWKVSEDAGSAVNRAWLVSKPTSGNGTQSNMSLFAQATRTLRAGEPRMDTADSSHDGISNGATLDGYAEGAARSNAAYKLTVAMARHSVGAGGVTSDLAEEIRPGDTILLSTRTGFYGPSTFAGRVVSISGDHEAMRLDIDRVARTDGVDPSATPAAVGAQRPAGDSASRIKELEAFVRRKNNPVTDKPGVPVIRAPIGLTGFNADFTNVDLTAIRLDPLGIVVVEGSFTANRMKMGTEAICTLADSHPLTQVSVSAIREGSTSETLQAWITTAGVLNVRCDPTIYSGNTVTMSAMYSITT